MWYHFTLVHKEKVLVLIKSDSAELYLEEPRGTIRLPRR